MKNILLIVAILFCSISFAQESSISGIVKDVESNNEPLVFAKVSIKETGTETITDENGHYKFEDIQAGEYTLVYSFVGYETIEKKITIANGNSLNESISLQASTISLDDMMAILASADKNDKT